MSGQNLSDFMREALRVAGAHDLRVVVRAVAVGTEARVLVIVRAPDAEIFWPALMRANKVSWLLQSVTHFDLGSGPHQLHLVKPL
jgi:hypothetical protein